MKVGRSVHDSCPVPVIPWTPDYQLDSKRFIFIDPHCASPTISPTFKMLTNHPGNIHTTREGILHARDCRDEGEP